MARKTENTLPFTQPRVAALPMPASGRTEWYDETQPGLTVRITSNGIKSFCVFKRLKHGKPVRITLGRFPTLTVDRARTLAAKHVGEMAGGVNPNEEKRAAELLGLTLNQAWSDYQEKRTGKLKPRTLKDYGKMLDRYLDAWLPKPVNSITREMVQRKHGQITTEHGPHAADDTMRVLRAILNFAIDKHATADGRSILPENPVQRGLRRDWNRPKRSRTALADHEVPAWWTGLQKLRATHPDTAELFELCFLTGMRPGEAARLRVDKVDLRAKTLEIEDTKNRDPLWLPLTEHVHALLERRCKAVTGKYVFPGPGKTGHLVAWKKGALELRKLA